MTLLPKIISTKWPLPIFLFLVLWLFFVSFTSINALPSTQGTANDGIDLIILLDQSGSMSKGDENAPPTDPDNLRVDAARYLIDYLAFDNQSVNPNRVNRVVVIGFGSYADLLVGLTELTHKDDVEQAKVKITGQNLGDTKFISALNMVRDVFPVPSDAELDNDVRRRIIVIITDGDPYDSRELDKDAYFAEIEQYYQQELGQDKYPLYVVGIDKSNSFWSDVENDWNKIASPAPGSLEQPHASRARDAQELSVKILDFLCPFLGEAGVDRDCRIVELGEHFIEPYASLAQFSFFKYRDDSTIELFDPSGTLVSKSPPVYVEHNSRTESYEIKSPPPGCWQTTKRGEGRVDVLTDISFKNSLELTVPSAPHPQLAPLQLVFTAKDESGAPIVENPDFPIRLEVVLTAPNGATQTVNIQPEPSRPGVYKSTGQLLMPVAGDYEVSVAGFVDIPESKYPCFAPPPGETSFSLFEIDKPFVFSVTSPGIVVSYPVTPYLQYTPLDKMVIDAVDLNGGSVSLPQSPPGDVEVELLSPSGDLVVTAPNWVEGSYEVPGPIILGETGNYIVRLKSYLPDGSIFHQAETTFETTQNIQLLEPPPDFPIQTPILTTTVQLRDNQGNPAANDPAFPLRMEAALLAPDETELEVVSLVPVTGTATGQYTSRVNWSLEDAGVYKIKVTGYLPSATGVGQPEKVAFTQAFLLNASSDLPRFDLIVPDETLPLEENAYTLHGGPSEFFQATPLIIKAQMYKGTTPVTVADVFGGNVENLLTAAIEDTEGNVLLGPLPLSELAEAPSGLLTAPLTDLTQGGEYQVRIHLDGNLIDGRDYENVIPDKVVPFRLYETSLYSTVRVVVLAALFLLALFIIVLLARYIYGFLPPYPRGTLKVKTTGLNGEILKEFPVNRAGIKRKRIVIKNKKQQIPSNLKLKKIVITYVSPVKSSRKSKSGILAKQGGLDNEKSIKIEAFNKTGKSVASGRLYGRRSRGIRSTQKTDDGKSYEFVYEQ